MTGRDADPKYEMNGRKHCTELRFADYIDKVYSGKVTNDYYMVANNVFAEMSIHVYQTLCRQTGDRSTGAVFERRLWEVISLKTRRQDGNSGLDGRNDVVW